MIDQSVIASKTHLKFRIRTNTCLNGCIYQMKDQSKDKDKKKGQ